ncbi:hypothetical protein AGDE_15205 [Angomonas deanei]|uniref:Uncharacterized protein n=1 Tax=Angomonas deanei TaxID=59799 RepID=A0A7G2C9S0_9TRYP|nr:hypothetical protein AGDE_15205 [Angomonas deanei]CAD2215791.1 hypothetical protein, conserved [Angomonas deanei]|eukprot:EPY19526.1 hypothetical protein AGDE_15205 [Angomonas deanei]
MRRPHPKEQSLPSSHCHQRSQAAALGAVGKGDAQDYLSLVHSGDSFVEPSTFFVVEEVFSGTEKFNSAAVSEWTVEEATGGFFDRTRIVPQSQKPQYNYECIVNLPHESVFLQQQVPTAEREELKSMQRRGVTLRKETLLDNTPAEIGNTKPCLQQVLLTLWHMQGPLDPVRNAEEEMQFWAKAAYIGECRVDLRPLRYIRRIEGYYRISRGDCRLPEVEGGAPLVLPPSSRNSGNTVGYVHLGISLV